MQYDESYELCNVNEFAENKLLWQFKTHCYRLLLWMTIASLSSQAITADNPTYGMRIKPLLSRVQPLHVSTNCLTCVSQTQQPKNNNTPVHRTESNVEVLTSVKQKRPTLDRRTDDQNVKIGNFYHTTKPLVKKQETAPSDESPRDNTKKGATFFFTQVEPNRFEYRAMFQHHRNVENNVFQPFVHDFNSFGKEFPPLPKFPSFPSFQEFFPDHKDPFPNFPEFSFPTLPPTIKRTWQPQNDLNPLKPILDGKLENPVVKDYDIVLGHNHYPKIFRFNEERINIEEFDRQKKLRFYSLGEKEQNELLEPENVKRDQLLILHGGIFTVQEPPLFNKHTHVKKRRKPGSFRSYRSRL